MRTLLGIILALLFVVIGAPNALADSFDATFTCSGTCTSTPSSTTATLTPAGPNSIADFTWDTVSWTFSLPINWRPTDSFSWNGFSDITGSGTHFLSFRITDLTVSNFLDVQDDALCPTLQACQVGFDSGVLSFSPVATPESSSIALVLAGIGLLLVIRKR
jgi:hypothetical protein